MKVKVRPIAWSCIRDKNGVPLSHIWTYECIAANGVIAEDYSEQYVREGEYTMPDKDWDPDSPRFNS